MRALLLLAMVSGCTENQIALRDGYTHHEDLEAPGPRIWESTGSGRGGWAQGFVSVHEGFGAPGRLDILVSDKSDLDQELQLKEHTHELLRVDVTGEVPVVDSVVVPVDISAGQVLHTGTDSSAFSIGGTSSVAGLHVFNGAQWSSHPTSGLVDARFAGASIATKETGGLRVYNGSSWTDVVGDQLGPADASGVITLSFEPGWVHVNTVSWTGQLLSTVSTEVPGERTLHVLGVVDNGTVDGFVASLGDCVMGELWSFDGTTFEIRRPLNVGELYPSRNGDIFATEGTVHNPLGNALRLLQDGQIGDWLEDRVYWGHGDEWACDSEDGALVRCQPNTITAHPDPGSAQVAIVTLDMTDRVPRIYLRQVQLPWGEDPTGGSVCGAEDCDYLDDPSNPNTECALLTSNYNWSTCIEPGTLAEGQRVDDGVPMALEPVAFVAEPADLDDIDVHVEPFQCAKLELSEIAPDYEAELFQPVSLTLSSPGYSPLTVMADPSVPENVDGETFVLNQGQVGGPMQGEFYAWSNEYNLVVGSTEGALIYNAFRDEWRDVDFGEPTLPLDISILGPNAYMNMVDGSIWLLEDGGGVARFSNNPVELVDVRMSQIGSWSYINSAGYSFISSNRGVIATYNAFAFGVAVHDDLSPQGAIARLLEDGSAQWHRVPHDTNIGMIELAPVGWAKPGSRVALLDGALAPGPIVLVEATVPMTQDDDCFEAAGGCTLTFSFQGTENPLSTSAIALARSTQHKEVVFVDATGVHRQGAGAVLTDAALGAPTTVAVIHDEMAWCDSGGCTIWSADTWPMTEVTSWNDGIAYTVRAESYRYFIFESASGTVRYDVINGSLVLAGSGDGRMANNVFYTLDGDRGSFRTPFDTDWVFARGDVTFAVTDELFMPPCVPFTQRRFVDGLEDGRELVCAFAPVQSGGAR